MFELLLSIHFDPVLQKLERDALMRCTKRDDLVNVIACPLLQFGICDLNGLAHEQATHRMRQDIDLGLRCRRCFERRKVAEKADQTHKRLAICLEATIIEIIVSKDPEGPAGIASGFHEIESHRRIDDESVTRKGALVEMLEFWWNIDGHLHRP